MKLKNSQHDWLTLSFFAGAWLYLLAAWGSIISNSAGAGFESAQEEHWAFQPVVRPEPPKSTKASWGRNEIDRFILARLEQEKLEPSPEADKLTLVRRAYFNLIGLPPTPAQVEAFLQDGSSDAFERLVDSLLASPHYGERWARHWLDIISFGETHGFEVNTPRPNAWPFRDYVIRAFQEDKPYPEFIRDQLAGDLTGEDAATGFIVAAAALLPGQIGRDLESMLLARQDELNDMVLITSGAFLGLTVSCARCHDHKFDPVPQVDYYAMQGVFAGVRHGERELRSADDEARQAEADRLKPLLESVQARLAQFEPLANPGAGAEAGRNERLRKPVNALKNVERFRPVPARGVRFTVLESTTLEPCLDELEIFTAGSEPVNVALASAGGKASASSVYPGSDIHRLEHINDGKYGNGRSWISNEKGKGWVQIDFPAVQTIDTIIWGRDRDGGYNDRLPLNYRIEVEHENGQSVVVASSADRQAYVPGQQAGLGTDAAEGLSPEEASELKRLTDRAAALKKKIGELRKRSMVYAGVFSEPEPVHRLHRGDPMQKREEVAPGALSRIGPALKLAPDAPGPERRLALAGWIGSTNNPLTARVLVNRLWHYHFGEGLVSTPSDFGLNGAPAVNQELLDWLAAEFMARGWSIKEMQRLICLSSTYRQSSYPNARGMAVDAGSRLLWRFPPRRMEAEVIRDTMLSVSGTLDLRMGGPGYSVFEPNDNYVRVYNPKQEYGPEEWRRMVYQTKIRMAQDPTFGAFDCPDAGQTQPKRPRSTTPIQALNLFNSEFVAQQAAYFARRLTAESGTSPARQIERAFGLAFGRPPDPSEAKICGELVSNHGLEALCRVILNANEFVFIN